MKIKWSPQKADISTTLYEQIEMGLIRINNEVELSFQDASIYEYTVPEEYSKFVIRAYRDMNGELCLDLFYQYTEAQKTIWENPRYCPSGYRGSEYEDYTNVVGELN